MAHMTDIDFRRMASLLLLLHLYDKTCDPVREAVQLADELLAELNRDE